MRAAAADHYGSSGVGRGGGGTGREGKGRVTSGEAVSSPRPHVNGSGQDEATGRWEVTCQARRERRGEDDRGAHERVAPRRKV